MVQLLKLIPCRETSKGAVHETGVYSAGVGPKGLALERFPDIKKKKIKKKKKKVIQKLNNGSISALIAIRLVKKCQVQQAHKKAKVGNAD